MPTQNLPFTQLGGVDSRSNPLSQPAGKALRCLNWRPTPDGHLELREGYEEVCDTGAAVPIHSICSYRWITDSGPKSIIVFWQGTTPKYLDLSDLSIHASTVKGTPIASSNRFSYYLANNKLHAVNGTDAKVFDGTYWRNLGLRTLTSAEAVAIVVTSSASPIGSELTDATGWTSTNWTGSYGGGFVHTTGFQDRLTRAITGITYGKNYRVVFTVSGMTAGTVDVTIGTAGVQTGIAVNGTYTADATAQTSDGISFNPSSDFNGTITAISVKLVTDGLPASSVGGAQPGYLFFACLYNPATGHVGNRVQIGNRQLFTDINHDIHFSGLPNLSAEDSEYQLLIGSTADGGMVPYVCTDASSVWLSVPNGTTSWTLTSKVIDGNSQLPVDNTLPPAGLYAVALVNDRAYGLVKNQPWVYRTMAAEDITTGDYVGRPEQSWPGTSETFPTAEASSAVFQCTGDALVASLNDCALLSDPMGTGQGWQGPWNNGWAGPFAGCTGFGGIPYGISGHKQLCTIGQQGPYSVSSEYEAGLLAKIADNALAQVEVVYERFPERMIDRIRIHFTGNDGRQHHVFHDFAIGAGKSPVSQYNEAYYGTPLKSPMGGGYETIYVGPLANAHTVATVRDASGSPKTYAGGSDGKFYVLDSGANDAGEEFTGPNGADWIGLITFGDGRPLVGPFEYHGDANVVWSVCPDISIADVANATNFEQLTQQAFPIDEDDNHWIENLNRPEMAHAFIRVQLDSHSADAPHGMALNDPPHCPLEVYGRVWVVSVAVGGNRG